jgi:hypothetical protein
MKFPEVEATSLAHKKFQLPADLEGEINLVVVAFKQWHQNLVDTWIPSLQTLAYQHPQLRVYELPTMPRFNPFVRYMIDSGMRGGIPDRSVRATTLCIYTNLDRFSSAIEIPNLETIYLFLLDRSGEVVWRGQGGFDQDRLNELATEIDRSTSKSPVL